MTLATRIFHPAPIEANQLLTLSESAAGHVARVLRMKPGEMLHLFDGHGGFYEAEVTDVAKRNVQVKTGLRQDTECEPPLQVHIGQGVSRGEKMDFTIQKAVELGVNEITPLLTERCGVKLQSERWVKKHQHWQQVAISACEQCGRNRIPTIHPPKPLSEWLQEPSDELKLNLHPTANHGINGLEQPDNGIRLVIGPEGGLSDTEISLASQHGFQSILLGPRVLRTETAALTALSALQVRFGDLG